MLEFWFEFASTYSYLSAARIEQVARSASVSVSWRAFLLGPIFADQGWNDSPFNLYPAKGRYMWREMQRFCARYEIPFQRPSRFPRNGLLGARIACAARDEPWCADFVRAVYRANFAQDREISEPAVIAEILTDLGRDAAAVLERAGSTEVKAALRAQTERAIELGIFGAPSFVGGAELFWGNDRLEDAIERCRAVGAVG